LVNLAVLALERGRHEVAQRRLRDAVARYKELGRTLSLVGVLDLLGACAVGRGEAARAMRLFAAAAAHRDRLGLRVPQEREPLLRLQQDKAVRLLGHEAAESARAQGRKLTLDEALREALDDQLAH
jgi:hypothetical protein